MQIVVDVMLDYDLSDPNVLLDIRAVHQAGQAVLSETIEAEGAEFREITSETGVGQRMWAHVPSHAMRLHYNAMVEVTRVAEPLRHLQDTDMRDLPGEVLTYLRPSRFCQSDMFATFVAREFEGLSGGARVAAIRDWVGSHMSYIPGASTVDTTVLDTFVSREGVCRDYAHMVCAMVRAAGVPARYASCYGPNVRPQDFHAVAQVWLEGAWRLIDATGMSDDSNAVLIAVGRDACDVAFMETSSFAYFLRQNINVWGPL